MQGGANKHGQVIVSCPEVVLFLQFSFQDVLTCGSAWRIIALVSPTLVSIHSLGLGPLSCACLP